MKKVVSLKTACQVLDRDRNTLYRWRKEGKVQMKRIDGRYYIDEGELARLTGREIEKGRINEHQRKEGAGSASKNTRVIG